MTNARSIRWSSSTAPSRDFHQSLPLLITQGSGERYLPAQQFQLAALLLAVFAVFQVLPAVRQADVHLLQRPGFSVGIHADRHRGAGAEGREQVLIGIRTQIVAAQPLRLVREPVVIIRVQISQETFVPFAHVKLSARHFG